MSDRMRAVAAATARVVGAPSPAASRRALEAVAREVVPLDGFEIWTVEADRTRPFGVPGAEERPAESMPWADVLTDRQPQRTATAIAVPILSNETLYGVLVVESTAPDRYTEADVEVVEVLASLAAAVLSNARLDEARLRAEQARRLADSRFRAVFEQLPLSMQVFDPDGWTLDVNRAWQELFRLPLDLLETFNPLRDAQLEDVRLLLEKGFAGETLTIPPHPFDPGVVEGEAGRSRWLEVTVCPVRGDDGQIQEVIVMHRDATAQVDAEAALQRAYDDLESRVETRTAELAQAEQRFRAIVEASPVPLLLTRVADGTVLFANDRVEDLVGAQRGELLGRKTPDFYFDPADRPAIIRTVQAEGFVRGTELRIRRFDGSPRWVSLSIQRLTYDGDEALATALVDITERKETEEALSESEASYRNLFDTLTELVYIQDLDGRFLNVNEAVVQAYGYPREELVGKTPAFLGVPGSVDPAAFAETFARAVAGEPQRFEWWGVRRDGSTFPKEVAIRRSSYFGQDVVIAVARDVTAQKEAQEALRTSEEHFRRLTENASDMVQIVDTEARIVYTGPSVERLLGYTPEEIEGTHAMAFLHRDDVDWAMEAVGALFAAPGTTRAVEYRVQHKDGGWRWFEANCRTLSPTSPDEGLVVNARDITERVETERALRFQKTLLEAEGEASIDGILVISEAGQILSFNARFVEMWGLSDAVIASRSDEAALGAVLDQVADPDAFLARVEYLYANPDEVARDEVALQDGRVLDRYSAPVKSREGEYYGRIWFFRDVTREHRHAEELDAARREAERAREQAHAYAQSLEHSLLELRAAQEHLVQQEKMAGLGRVTAGIAHELKNPLNFVTNFSLMNADLVGEVRAALEAGDPALAGELLADLEANARKVNEHGHRANGIVQRMMEHARTGPEERQAVREAVDVNALVAEELALLAEMHRRLEPQAGVVIEEAYDDALAPFEAAPDDLRRIVQILVSNAFDAVAAQADRAGADYIPRIAVRTGRDEGTITLGVTDNGEGIPEGILSSVFEPFFTTRPAGSGHPGLGLSYAHETIVNRYGGRLDVESEDGQGATFLLTLPRK